MKETQTAVLDGFKSFGKASDPLPLPSKAYSMNGTGRERYNSEHEENDGNGFSNARTSLPHFAASDLLETQSELPTKLPELEFYHKEMTHHIVKDIRIDKGMPVRQGSSNKIINNDRSGHSISQTTEGDSAVECTKAVALNECAIKDEGNSELLLAQEKQTLPSRNSPMEDTAKHCSLKDSMQKSETNIDEISRKEVTKDPAASSSEVGPKEDTEICNLHHRNKVESGNVTLHFNPSIPVMTTSVTTNGGTETGEVLGGNDGDSKKMCFNNNTDPSFGKINQPYLNNMDGFSNGHATSHVESLCSKGMIDETSHNQFPDDKEENSDSLSSHGNLGFASSRVMNTTHTDDQASELRVYKNEQSDSSNDSALTPGKHDVGESSFSSSARLIAYSEPTAFSGSLSLRSDSSAATSGRSFAFPILQPEWNSSPVRMSKEDNGHFRKHKGWRSGILCCRF